MSDNMIINTGFTGVYSTDKLEGNREIKQVNTANNVSKMEKTSEDDFIEYEISDFDTDPDTTSECDLLRQQYDNAQDEYFRLQQQLIALKRTLSTLQSSLRACKNDNNRAEKIQTQISDTNAQIGTVQQNIEAAEANMQDLNTQIINSILEENDSVSPSSSTSGTNSSKTFYSSAPYSGEAIPKDLANKLDSKLGNGFSKKCEDVAAKLNCNANDLLAMMYSESGLSPNVQGGSGSVGLIQFMPSTLSANGYSASQVAGMSAVEQLDVVADILGKSKAMSGFSANDKIDAGSLYAICFLPAAAKNDVLCSSSGKLSWAYRANSPLDLNSDGSISKSDLAARLNQKYNEMLSAI